MSGTIGDARKRKELRLLDTGPVTLIPDAPMAPTYPVTDEERARLARDAAEARSRMRSMNKSALRYSAEVCKAAGYQVLKFGGLTSMEREEIDALKVAEL